MMGYRRIKAGHALEPDDARGRFLRPAQNGREELRAALVSDRDQVRAVVHGDDRPVVQGLMDVAVVGLGVLALDGEDRNAVVFDQGRRDVVLGAERVGRAEADVRSAELESFHQVGRFGGHVEAGRDPEAAEGLGPGEGLLDEAQNGHGAGRPFHTEPALAGQGQVLDVIQHRFSL